MANNLLNQRWIDSLPDVIVENLQKQNDYILRVICERIKQIGEINPADQSKLKSALEYAGADLAKIEAYIKKTTGINQKELTQIFEKAAAENVDFANTYYKYRGMEPLEKYADNSQLQEIVEAIEKETQKEYTNISKTTGFKIGGKFKTIRAQYLSAIDQAILAVTTGATDYYTAMRGVVRDMAQSGIRTVDFASGYTRRMDSQARMNILDAVRQLNMRMQEKAGEEFGADGYEISAHSNCAPDHIDIQGKQYTKEEYEKLNNRLTRAIGEKNCKHFATPIIMGVSKPVYTSKELKRIKKESESVVEYKGNKYTKYQATQVQRRFETAIRQAKSERDAYKASGDKILEAAARKRAAAKMAEYKKFSEAVGLRTYINKARNA